jgi:hypothetical protein
MYAVDNILGGDRDLWAVNVEQEYHEEKDGPVRAPAEGARTSGTGREAPFHPPPASPRTTHRRWTRRRPGRPEGG